MDKEQVNNMGKEQVFENIFKEHIKIESFTKTVDNLFTPRMKNKTNHSPCYQRNYVWDDNKATHFIESIFLGTELPPLIFFDNHESIEIVDGRQRYETMMRFMEDQFALKMNGLAILTQLKGLKYSTLNKKSNNLLDHFLECKIRIIQFQIVNHPPLEKELQDKVKKEIFLRYNSGITPLKREEVDDARYDADSLTNYFKNKLKNLSTHSTFAKVLFPGSAKKISIAKIMSQVRTELVLPKYPIYQFSKGGSARIIEQLYDYFTLHESDSHSVVYDQFFKKVKFLEKIITNSTRNKLQLNHLALRSILWGLGVLEVEKIAIDYNKSFIHKCSEFINNNIQYFSTEYSTRRENIENRYIITQQFFESLYKISLEVYMNENKRIDKIKKDLKNKKSKTKLDSLKEIGLSKPEPSNMSIEDVTRRMNRRKFLVRPSYQRVEVIDRSKKSSIIESVLLGIKLPPIFIFKRNDDVSEVIDGQQRLLTLLGFTGSTYTGQDDKVRESKDNNFKLQGLRILSELNGKKFKDLSQKLQDKIYDFQLYIVEIDASKNINFDPIDLFIRLNDKPYPIKTNSFEMWNSWVDLKIIDPIKELKIKLEPWFHVKKIERKSDRDRMENEELIMSLVYIEYHSQSKAKVVDVYQKDNIDLDRVTTSKLAARINSKSKINSLLMSCEKSEDVKKEFINAIKKVKSVIRNLKYILIDRNPKEDELEDEFLLTELNRFIKVGNTRKLQNFSFLWILINQSNFNLVKYLRTDMKRDLIKIFKIINNSHKNLEKNNINKPDLVSKFNSEKEIIHKNYTAEIKRSKRLSEKEKEDLIKKQNNKSSISGAPIYLWDDIHVDHTVPLALKGKDEIDNMGIAHGKENREKGAKFPKN